MSNTIPTSRQAPVICCANAQVDPYRRQKSTELAKVWMLQLQLPRDTEAVVGEYSASCKTLLARLRLRSPFRQTGPRVVEPFTQRTSRPEQERYCVLQKHPSLPIVASRFSCETVHSPRVVPILRSWALFGCSGTRQLRLYLSFDLRVMRQAVKRVPSLSSLGFAHPNRLGSCTSLWLSSC